MYKTLGHNSFKILNRNNVILSFINFSITDFKEIIYIHSTKVLSSQFLN